MLIWLHAAAAAVCAALLGSWFFLGRPTRRAIGPISACLIVVMTSGLALMMLAGGLAYSSFFGHVMHWLGWLAVLAWLHALVRARSTHSEPRGGISFVLVMAACAAGILALVQPRI